MEPCETSCIIQPIPNPETGQQEFRDHQHVIAHLEGVVMIIRHLISKKLGRWIRPGEIVFIVVGHPQNIGDKNLPLKPPAKLARSTHGHMTVQYCPFCGVPLKISRSHKKRYVFDNKTCQRVISRKFEIDPEELRELLWEIPTTEIANLYGISNKAIEKRCRAFGFPKPLRGYWSDLQHDRSLSQDDQK